MILFWISTSLVSNNIVQVSSYQWPLTECSYSQHDAASGYGDN